MQAVRPWIPAILLSLLVLGVFGLLQGFGPESVLRRFHVAAVNNDLTAMAEYSVAGSSGENLELLKDRIQSLARAGGRYEVRHVQRNRGYAVAIVTYLSPNGQLAIPVPFAVDKRDGQWLVNPDATLELMRQYFGPPGYQ